MLEEMRQHAEVAAGLAAGSVASWSSLSPLSEVDVVECLLEAYRAQQAQAMVMLRAIREVEDRLIPGAQGCRSTVEWLRTRLRLDPRHARQLAGQARAVLERPAVVQAVLDRELDVAQAMVIAEAVDAIPDTVAAADKDSAGPGSDPAEVEAIAQRAEAVLVGTGGRFPPYQLRRLGDRILTHVAPEVAERAEAAALRQREARAFAKRSLSLSLPIDGVVYLRGALGVEDAAIVNAALDPLCRPQPADERSAGQRRADALVDVCRLVLRTGELPDNGGELPQATVTIPYETLTGGAGAGTTETGERFSAEVARRMACEARILPVVLGGESQVLDVGRARRLVPVALRRALFVRDRGCAFPGCDRPPRWCDLHHLQPWAQGGPTSLSNLVVLCRHHHRVVHQIAFGWQVYLASDGLPEFTPPPWSDPAQRPCRNLYHPRN